MKVTASGDNAVIERLGPGEDVTLTFEKAVPEDETAPSVDGSWFAKSAYANAGATLSIPVAQPIPASVQVEMTAVRQEWSMADVVVGFDVLVTNDGDQALYAVNVEGGSGGSFTEVPEGVAAEGHTARIDVLPAGETLRLGYEVPISPGSGAEEERIDEHITVTGWADEAQTDSVTTFASAGVVLKRPEPTPTPAPSFTPEPTAAPSPAPTPNRLPINVLIIGLAALALFGAIGLMVMARRKQ